MRFERKCIWRVLVIVVLGSGVTACVPAFIAGGAAAGYYAGQDERTVGEIVDDAGITTAVKTRLFKDPQVSAIDINVDTRNGVVILYGTVSSRAKETRIIELTKQVKGVKKIISRISIVE
ncbi:MAG: BON domain-containing protein [Gammaproteobacteria bacterium]